MGAGGAGRKILTWTGDVDEFWPSSKKPGRGGQAELNVNVCMVKKKRTLFPVLT
jgi:hypothetical protein